MCFDRSAVVSQIMLVVDVERLFGYYCKFRNFREDFIFVKFRENITLPKG